MDRDSWSDPKFVGTKPHRDLSAVYNNLFLLLPSTFFYFLLFSPRCMLHTWCTLPAWEPCPQRPLDHPYMADERVPGSWKSREPTCIVTWLQIYEATDELKMHDIAPGSISPNSAYRFWDMHSMWMLKYIWQGQTVMERCNRPSCDVYEFYQILHQGYGYASIIRFPRCTVCLRILLIWCSCPSFKLRVLFYFEYFEYLDSDTVH